ncbi:MAG: Extracellular ligand-binding receptor [Aeromicrobium sp.]|nr:Extracellular ligand-binding receptor [Aeromicrobium sp.]
MFTIASPLKSTNSKARPMHRTALIALASAALVLTAACAPKDNTSSSTSGSGGGKAPIKMLGLFDLTGGDAAAGTAVAQATRYAIDQQNKAGGINGHKIELSEVDDASDAATAVLQYRKFVSQDGGKIILGPTYSPLAVAICPLAQKDKVLDFTQSATNIAVTTPMKKYCFGNAPTGALSARSIVKLMQSMGKKRIGMMIDSSVYGQQGVDSVKKYIQGTGMQLVATSTIDVQATDATAQVNAMKKAKVDAVVLAAVPIPGTAGLKAFYQQNVGVPLYSFGGIFLPATADLVTSSAPIEFYMTSPASCPQTQFFKKCGVEARPAFQSDAVPGYGINGYYPTKALFAALKTAKSFEPDDIVAALESAPAFTNDFTLPLKYSSTSHLGVQEQMLEGYKGGKVYFFGNDINNNQYQP